MWADRYKNPILNSTDGRITVSTGRTDTLTISAVNHDDAKEYYCFAFVYFFNDSSSVIQEQHLFRPVEVHGELGAGPWLMLAQHHSFACNMQSAHDGRHQVSEERDSTIHGRVSHHKGLTIRRSEALIVTV